MPDKGWVFYVGTVEGEKIRQVWLPDGTNAGGYRPFDLVARWY